MAVHTMQDCQDRLKRDWLDACYLCIQACTSGNHSIGNDSSLNYEKDLSNGQWTPVKRHNGKEYGAANIHVHGRPGSAVHAELKLWHKASGKDPKQEFEDAFKDCLDGLYKLIQERLREYLIAHKTLVVQTDEVKNTSTISRCYHDVNKQLVMFPPDARQKFCHIVVRQRKDAKQGYRGSSFKHFCEITVDISFTDYMEYAFYEMQQAFLGICTQERNQRKLKYTYKFHRMDLTKSFLKLKWHPIVKKPAGLYSNRRLALAISQHKKSEHSHMNKLSNDLIHKIVEMVEDDEIWEIDSDELLVVMADWNNEFREILDDYPKFTVGSLISCARCGLIKLQ